MKVLIDNGHGSNTPGKRSPDGMLMEYAWTREIAAMIVADLKSHGVDASLLVPEMEDIPLKERVRRVNYWCDLLGKRNVLLVSVHNNAAGNGKEWKTARGFSVFVSKNASLNSRRLADIMYRWAAEHGLLGNRAVPKVDADGCVAWTWSWTDSDIYILKNTKCPAVLTENFFMDNREDCEWLLSEEGKEACVRLHVDAVKRYLDETKKL